MDLTVLIKGHMLHLGLKETKVKVTFFISKLMLKPNSNYFHEPPDDTKGTSGIFVASLSIQESQEYGKLRRLRLFSILWMEKLKQKERK